MRPSNFGAGERFLTESATVFVSYIFNTLMHINKAHCSLEFRVALFAVEIATFFLAFQIVTFFTNSLFD